MRTVLIASDKFKGSLGAPAVCAAVGRGLAAHRPDLRVVRMPIADGGDGTLDAALGAGYARREVQVAGPTGERLAAAFAWHAGTATAVVEMAQASGLERLPGGVLAPLAATTYGTGELVRAALDAGARRIILGVGGSASTDGGLGFLEALGALAVNHRGRALGRGGGALADLGRLDFTTLDARLATCEFILATDVDNPLLGPRGAAAVYAPQKGASPAEVAALDDGLRHFADAVHRACGSSAALRDKPGAGAAGGLGFAALAVLEATPRAGVEVVLELVGFAETLAQLGPGDLVITGEGSLDAQTLSGKAPAGVARAATARGLPVIAVCGRQSLTTQELEGLGISRAYALTSLEQDVQLSIRNADSLLGTLGHRIAEDWFAAP
ncbi:glycerate kinase [Arthrobacter sp. TMN-37]